MKVELDDEELKRIVTALEHYYAFTRATNRDDSSYQAFVSPPIFTQANRSDTDAQFEN